jgi:nicotinate-nucleotide adenylyltransferase
MRSTRIGILGGAFDPPHFMHRDMSKLVIAKGIVDEVWLMPCYSHPHNKKMAPARDRAFMCTLLLGNNPDPIGVSFLEIEHKLSGRTNEMWDVLQKQPSHKTCQLLQRR